jgi:hypothetical protein
MTVTSANRVNLIWISTNESVFASDCAVLVSWLKCWTHYCSEISLWSWYCTDLCLGLSISAFRPDDSCGSLCLQLDFFIVSFVSAAVACLSFSPGWCFVSSFTCCLSAPPAAIYSALLRSPEVSSSFKSRFFPFFTQVFFRVKVLWISLHQAWGQVTQTSPAQLVDCLRGSDSSRAWHFSARSFSLFPVLVLCSSVQRRQIVPGRSPVSAASNSCLPYARLTASVVVSTLASRDHSKLWSFPLVLQKAQIWCGFLWGLLQ